MHGLSLLTQLRAMAHQGAHAALSIGGLAVGIAVAIVLGLYVRFENSFETWLPDHGKIYVMQTVWSMPDSPVNGAYPYVMGGLLDQLEDDFPGIVGTRIRGGENGGVVMLDGVAEQADVVQVDPRFLDVFNLPLAQGSDRGGLRRALGDPTAMLISESAAQRFFGDADPIGGTLNVAVDRVQSYRVAGVFKDLPANTDLAMSIILPMPRTAPDDNWFNWGSSSLRMFLRFETPDAAHRFEAQLPPFVDRRGAELDENPSQILQLKLLPIANMHLEPEGSASASERLTVAALGGVGLLTLLIALVNYVNLATARALLRAREVAMRKVLGADRARLIRQFLGEAILTVGVAALCALALAELGLPLVNAAGGLELSIPYGFVVLALSSLSVVIGVMAGFYPALLLSRFQPAAVLASARSFGGGRSGARVRELLVIVQFGLSTAFIIGTAVLFAQTSYIRTADKGFQSEGLIAVLSTRDGLVEQGQRRAFLEAVRALPNVSYAAIGNTVVGGSGESNAQNVVLPGLAGEGPSLRWEIVGPDFFAAYAPRLLAGRPFDARRVADEYRGREESAVRHIVINRQAIETFRFASAEDAIGKTVGGDRPMVVIGVIDDLRFLSPREPVPPTFYLFTHEPESVSTAVTSVRFTGAPHAMLARLEQVWQRLVPQVPFEAETAQQRLDQFYEADEQAMRLFAFGTGLAVLIGCVGLWGLASFSTARRLREIGIRKSLGASTRDIVRLLVVQFLRPVVIANLIAWPLAWAAMSNWLAGFNDRIALSPLYFLGAGLLAALIAGLTVLGQSLRAARAAPAWALRHD